MAWLSLLCVWIHVVAACAWVGSMIFFSAVVIPAMRAAGVNAASSTLVSKLGPRYRVFGWSALAVLFVTGAFNLHARGIDAGTLCEPGFWLTSFGRTLGAKLLLIVFVLGATTTHERFMRTHRPPADRESAEAIAYRKRASRVGRATLGFSLVVVFFAVALVRGMP
ncbi:MAG TPA: DUF4149 domain-containing protein [Polyangiaceae bacterium]